MPELVAIEVKAHLPARNFGVSKQFYQDIGFTLCWSNPGLAYLHYGPHGEHGRAGFLLQDYYVKEFAENLQMHLLVKDVDAWWAQIQAKQISQKYGVQTGPLRTGIGRCAISYCLTHPASCGALHRTSIEVCVELPIRIEFA